jgi:hypothetical protein
MAESLISEQFHARIISQQDPLLNVRSVIIPQAMRIINQETWQELTADAQRMVSDRLNIHPAARAA